MYFGMELRETLGQKELGCKNCGSMVDRKPDSGLRSTAWAVTEVEITAMIFEYPLH